MYWIVSDSTGPLIVFRTKEPADACKYGLKETKVEAVVPVSKLEAMLAKWKDELTRPGEDWALQTAIGDVEDLLNPPAQQTPNAPP